MKSKKGILIGLIVVAAVGGLVAANLRGRKKGTEVTIHTVEKKDIVARVSCTGAIEAKRKVEISANVMGQIVNLAVREGDRVEKSQFLLQIDRAQLQAQTTGREAYLQALLADRDGARANALQAEDAFARAEKNYGQRIISDADMSRARAARDGADAQVHAVERRIEQGRAELLASRDSLSKTTIVAPIEGIVSALPVEEGEIAVIGTMNNPGTKLMTISDMSIVQAVMEVDETDVPQVKIGQKAAITIDALPGQTFAGTVAEIGSSPIPRNAGGSQAVEFEVKIVLQEPPDSVRPGFSVSGHIDTGEARDAVAIPVQALVVQDLAERYAEKEKAAESTGDASVPLDEVAPGPEERDVEGVFQVVDGKAKFVPIKTGLQGELLVEVKEGVKAGDAVVTGPFRTLRQLKDGEQVRPEKKDGKKKKGEAAGARA